MQFDQLPVHVADNRRLPEDRRLEHRSPRNGRPRSTRRRDPIPIIWAEIGDARRFTSSDQLVRFAGLDVTVYSSESKSSPGHLSRQGSPELRWAAFEPAKCAARRGSPGYAYYHRQVAKHEGHNGKNPTLAVEHKILRRAITPRATWAMPHWRCPTPDSRR